MSQYRYEIHNGILIRAKRKLLRFWIWRFNRSEEDELNKLKNQMSKLKHQMSLIARRIPHEEARIRKIRDGLRDRPGEIQNDIWSSRKEPIPLILEIKTAKKKGHRSPPSNKSDDNVIAKIVTR